jgi:hypothetical protein
MHEKINNLESIHYMRIAVQHAVIGVEKLLQNHGMTDAPADYQMSFTCSSHHAQTSPASFSSIAVCGAWPIRAHGRRYCGAFQPNEHSGRQNARPHRPVDLRAIGGRAGPELRECAERRRVQDEGLWRAGMSVGISWPLASAMSCEGATHDEEGPDRAQVPLEFGLEVPWIHRAGDDAVLLVAPRELVREQDIALSISPT